MAVKPERLFRVEDDLTDTWIEEFARDGIEAVEAYIAKHLAFLNFIDDAKEQQ